MSVIVLQFQTIKLFQILKLAFGLFIQVSDSGPHGHLALRMPASLRQTDINPPERAPFNITIIQVYAQPSGHDDSEVDHFYQQLQETIDQTLKKDILVLQWDWNAKVGKDARADWGEVCGPYCSVETNERGLRLIEFAIFNNLVLTNTLGPHKPSRRWT